MFLTMSDLATTKHKNGLLPVCAKTIRKMISRGEYTKPTHRIAGKDCWSEESHEAWINSVRMGQE
jgi:hypothetical protein